MLVTDGFELKHSCMVQHDVIQFEVLMSPNLNKPSVSSSANRLEWTVVYCEKPDFSVIEKGYDNMFGYSGLEIQSTFQ